MWKSTAETAAVNYNILCKNPCAAAEMTYCRYKGVWRMLMKVSAQIIHTTSLIGSNDVTLTEEFSFMTRLHLSNPPLGHSPPPSLTCSPVSRSQSAGWSWGRCAGRAPALWWSSDNSGEGGTPLDIQGRWCNPPRWRLKHLRTPLWHRQKPKGDYWWENRENTETKRSIFFKNITVDHLCISMVGQRQII